MKPLVRNWLFLASFMLGVQSLWAQDQLSYQTLLPRWREDLQSFSSNSDSRSQYEKMKFIKLNEASTSFVSFGGEYRLLYDRFENELWGSQNPDQNGLFFSRAMFHADFHLNEKSRLFIDLVNGLVWDNQVPQPAVEHNEFDLHQLFFEHHLDSADQDTQYTMRVGRQEMKYGSERLIGLREGPNVRLSFDGAVISRKDNLNQTDLIITRPVVSRKFGFDDFSNEDRSLWGIYSIQKLNLDSKILEAYYLGHDNKNAVYDQGSGQETRNTLGMRFANTQKSWDLNFETMYQFGTFKNGNIEAWGFASDTGYTLKDRKYTPRISLKANAASGDQDLNDSKLQTFSALFPKGRYFGWPAIIGPYNFMDIHPELLLKLNPKTSLLMDWDFFWRQSNADGVYDTSGGVLRSGRGSKAYYVGSQASVEISYKPWDLVEVGTCYSRFFAGEFIKESGPHNDIDYINAWFHFRF